MKRIVIKVGSNVLTRKDGTLDVTRMSALVDQIAQLRLEGLEVILVSSGAVASVAMATVAMVMVGMVTQTMKTIMTPIST